MPTIHSWNTVDKDGWLYQNSQRNFALLVFALDKLPDFSEPRFAYLSEKVDGRPANIIHKQVQTLRQLHSFGEMHAFSLRIKKTGHHLTLYIICRISKNGEITKEEQINCADRIIAALPHEYTFRQISQNTEDWKSALDPSWIQQGVEIFKPEEKFAANTLPYFYSVPLWAAENNDMSLVCRTMLKSKINTVIEITLFPTNFIAKERSWVDTALTQLKNAQVGERVYSGSTNKLLKQFDPMPGLKAPVENYENLIKRYDNSRLFLSSIRVFGAGDPTDVVEALISGATKTKPQIMRFLPGSDEISSQKIGYANIDYLPEIHTSFWDQNAERPFRAQRIHRLVDLEESSNFWRIPIPVSSGFPGFELDTGLGADLQGVTSSASITLGTYIDDPAKANSTAGFSKHQLTKHGLIVGVPGSGKTTALFNILHQLWYGDDLTPFMVLEPAKTEFRALKNIERFKENMLVFTLGDERLSPFRFNPFEVLPGIPLESHISRLNACFIGAFDLFDPLPLLLDKAIRQTYASKGWYDESIGGEYGVETPTLSDLCRTAEQVISSSGYSDKLRDDFRASLLQRLNSLRRGSKGRMLDTKQSIPFETLMSRPTILELDALNEDEKALLMMFLLSSVYEYCKIKRKSGSPLKHVLVVEEAHNLIGATYTSSEHRANPKEQTINLFIKMLAEMRALGEGILIADQLPTAIAPQAVKQTNIKILMRLTAKDDREEIGNTMDLSESEMKNVVHFKTGYAYIYHEGLDRIRMVEMLNYKKENNIEEPPSDEELADYMQFYELENPHLFRPFAECLHVCDKCNRRVRSQAETFVDYYLNGTGENSLNTRISVDKQNAPCAHELITDSLNSCQLFYSATKKECGRLLSKYGIVNREFPICAYLHMLHSDTHLIMGCKQSKKTCRCKLNGHEHYISHFKNMLTGD